MAADMPKSTGRSYHCVHVRRESGPIFGFMTEGAAWD